ncbi:TonB-dependent receptor [Spongiimicrobium sp. 2-473A-2-J]|uniref:TonB-dependent receptor n=1 Tax=Eudoraea algarum TaxID=3417568 RepID=UPI003D35F35C
MKNVMILMLFGLFSTLSEAQEQKVALVPGLVQGIKPMADIVLKTQPLPREFALLPSKVTPRDVPGNPAEAVFRLYKLHASEENWYTQQDIYNSMQAKVPGLRIANTQFNQQPSIAMRGHDRPVIIVDGIQYQDTSVLNALNPQDIEQITIANSVAATNYLLNNRN